MAGSAVNRGGVRFEHLATVDDANFVWWARMRNHSGHGLTIEAAADDLIEEIEKELTAARSARDTLRAAEEGRPAGWGHTEIKETSRPTVTPESSGWKRTGDRAAEAEIVEALSGQEVWWRCHCHDTLLSECPNRDKMLAALMDRAAEEGRPFDTKRMTHAWAILESRVQVGDNATEAWEPDRYNAAGFVAALLREYARLGDRAAEEGR